MCGEHARHVHRLALRAVGDLVPAAGAVGDDDRVAARRAPPAAGSARPSASTPRSARPRSRSAGHAAARALDQLRLRAGNQAQHVEHGGHGAEGLLVAVAVQQQRLPWRACSGSAKRPAAASRATNSSNSSARAASRSRGGRPAPCTSGPRRAASAGTTARGRRSRTPASAQRRSASSSARRARLRLVDQPGGELGAAAAQRTAVAPRRARAPCSRRPAARAARRVAFSVSKWPLKVSTNSTAAAAVRARRAASSRDRQPDDGVGARQKVSLRQRGSAALRRQAEQPLAQRAQRRAAGRAGSAATAKRLASARVVGQPRRPAGRAA